MGYDHLYTTDLNECYWYGWSCNANPAKYVYTYDAGGMCQLQRGYRLDTGEHFVSISNYEVGYMNGSIHMDGTIGYVYPAVIGQACRY